MRAKEKTKLQKFLKNIFLPLFFGGLLSCNPTLEEVCQKEFPRFQLEISEVSTRFATSEFKQTYAIPSHALDSGRAPAQADNRIWTLQKNAQAQWVRWSLQRIDQLQDFMDLLDADPRLLGVREQVSRVSSEMVLFYGYARDGKLNQMESVLQRMKALNQGIGAEICTPDQAHQEFEEVPGGPIELVPAS